MLRPDRLTAAAMERGTSLITAGSHHAAGALRGRVRALTFVGTALALAGTGSAAAATTAGSSPTPLTAAAHAAPPITAASDAAAVVIPVAGPRAVLGHAVTTVADPPLPSQGAAARARPTFSRNSPLFPKFAGQPIGPVFAACIRTVVTMRAPSSPTGPPT